MVYAYLALVSWGGESELGVWDKCSGSNTTMSLSFPESNRLSHTTYHAVWGDRKGGGAVVKSLRGCSL